MLNTSVYEKAGSCDNCGKLLLSGQRLCTRCIEIESLRTRLTKAKALLARVKPYMTHKDECALIQGAGCCDCDFIDAEMSVDAALQPVQEVNHCRAYASDDGGYPLRECTLQSGHDGEHLYGELIDASGKPVQEKPELVRCVECGAMGNQGFVMDKGEWVCPDCHPGEKEKP